MERRGNVLYHFLCLPELSPNTVLGIEILELARYKGSITKFHYIPGLASTVLRSLLLLHPPINPLIINHQLLNDQLLLPCQRDPRTLRRNMQGCLPLALLLPFLRPRNGLDALRPEHGVPESGRAEVHGVRAEGVFVVLVCGHISIKD